jgi:threonine/homoserine/homoserine lactone efflux protein
MNELLTILFAAARLGLTAGLMPGPLQTVLIQHTLLSGWKRAIFGIFAPILADIPVVLVIMLLLSQFPPILLQGVRIIGGCFLLYLTWGTLRSWRRGETLGNGTAPEVQAASSDGRLRFLLRMTIVSLLSPMPYLFWGTVNGPLLREALAISALGGAAFIVVYYVPLLGVLSGWVLVFDRLRHLDQRITRGIVLLAAVVLALLGLQLIAQGLGLIA